MISPRGSYRPWYPGRAEPDEGILGLFESIEPSPKILYDLADPSAADEEFGGVVRGVYDKMDSLKRNPDGFRTWAREDGYVMFYDILTDLAPTDLRARVQILQQLGGFKFKVGVDADGKKQLIASVFAPLGEEEDPSIFSSSRANRLAQIWSPQKDTLLDYIIGSPAQTGRVLSDRLNPSNPAAFRLIGHPFADVRSTELQPIAEARVVAYERQGEIHIIPAVGKILQRWDEDAAGAGVEQINLLETLLLHEIVELVIDEAQPDLTPLNSHIIATLFERYLKGAMLTVAVEDFFLDWPPLSTQEEEERTEALLAQELEQATAMFQEEEVPDDLDGDLGDLDELPLDTASTENKPAKKKVAKKRAGKKRVVKKKRE